MKWLLGGPSGKSDEENALIGAHEDGLRLLLQALAPIPKIIVVQRFETLTLNFPLSYPFVLGARTDPCSDFRNMSVGFKEIGDIAVSVTHHH